jgi:hypothetical protein
VSQRSKNATHHVDDVTEAVPEWEREWADAAAVDRAEESTRRFPVLLGIVLAVAATVAGLLPAIFPLSPGYPSRDTTAQVIAAAIASAAAVGIVPVTALLTHRVNRDGIVVFGLALLSAGAAAIHFAVAKGHFDEYFLFGLFFVLSGLAQLAWAVVILFTPTRLFLAFGGLGNLLIAAVWAVDRIWGLPIGREHWTPEPVGFADVIASTFEVALGLGCLALVTGRARMAGALRRRRGVAFALSLAVAALTALSLLSAVGIGSPLITPSA